MVKKVTLLMVLVSMLIVSTGAVVAQDPYYACTVWLAPYFDEGSVIQIVPEAVGNTHPFRVVSDNTALDENSPISTEPLVVLEYLGCREGFRTWQVQVQDGFDLYWVFDAYANVGDRHNMPIFDVISSVTVIPPCPLAVEPYFEIGDAVQLKPELQGDGFGNFLELLEPPGADADISATGTDALIIIDSGPHCDTRGYNRWFMHLQDTPESIFLMTDGIVVSADGSNQSVEVTAFDVIEEWGRLGVYDDDCGSNVDPYFMIGESIQLIPYESGNDYPYRGELYHFQIEEIDPWSLVSQYVEQIPNQPLLVLEGSYCMVVFRTWLVQDQEGQSFWVLDTFINEDGNHIPLFNKR